jgi:hypothetical protein
MSTDGGPGDPSDGPPAAAKAMLQEETSEARQERRVEMLCAVHALKTGRVCLLP